MLYELPEFEYFEPSTLKEALEILGRYEGRAKILGGGTDLLGLMKDRVSGREMPIPSALVNIKKIEELKRVSHGESETVVGSAVTLSEIASDPVINERYAAFAQAAGSVATYQIRNMGTLGGNLCQRPWCWYFRHPAFDCFKKGGKQCYAITGDNSTYFSVYNLGTCVMSHPSDTAPALISLGAKVKIASPRESSRSKEIDLEDFFLGPKNVQDNILKPDEIVVSVRIPRGEVNSVYIKHRVRNNWDFALASVAASGSLDPQDGTIRSLRLVLGGVAPLPILLKQATELGIGRKNDAKLKQEIQTLLTKQAKPLRMNRYKVRVIRALAVRALDSIFAQTNNSLS
ncbi:MAG TPA: FAD binding domain-containing protein [Nitrososphaerales archaeon]|nr:FAD binding domain-containing protein [Nitrososphaerales archaeon]